MNEMQNEAKVKINISQTSLKNSPEKIHSVNLDDISLIN